MLVLAAARGLHVAGVLSVFGTLLAGAIGIGGNRAAQVRLLVSSVAVAFVAAPVWLVLQAGEMAGAMDLAGAWAATPVALFSTEFGHAMLLRLGALGVAAALGRGGRIARGLALVAAAVASIAQVHMGHAAAPEAPWQALAAAEHMLAAGAWIGGLLPLVIAVDAAAARRFSYLGMLAVAAIAVSALAQAAVLVGGLPGLLGTAYGRTVLLKVLLFGVLLGFAAYHRLVLTPALAGADPAAAARRMRRSVAMEAAVGLATVLVAAWLSALEPGAHEQPVWPLPWQPSLQVFDDPDMAAKLYLSFGLILASVVLAAAVAVWPRLRARYRLAGFAASAVVLGVAAPGLGLMAMPAYPTSFFESPLAFTSRTVAAGAALYLTQCAACHGAEGHGDGPLAPSLRMHPLPLTGFHLLERSDGEMFWLLSRGVPDGSGGLAMPGFGQRLSENQRWALIAYVQTLAGATPHDKAVPAHHHH
jgi:putative copper export protein/mono/diheme cytochrome c family protein